MAGNTMYEYKLSIPCPYDVPVLAVVKDAYTGSNDGSQVYYMSCLLSVRGDRRFYGGYSGYFQCNGAELNNGTFSATLQLQDSGQHAIQVAFLQIDLDGTSSGVTKKKIKFTIDGTSYEADEGMTWGEWVNSSYNTGGFVIQGQKIMRNNYVVRKNSGGDALSSDYIVSGTSYALTSQHNGGAG